VILEDLVAKFLEIERKSVRSKNAPIGKVENVNVAEVKDFLKTQFFFFLKVART